MRGKHGFLTWLFRRLKNAPPFCDLFAECEGIASKGGRSGGGQDAIDPLRGGWDRCVGEGNQV